MISLCINEDHHMTKNILDMVTIVDKTQFRSMYLKFLWITLRHKKKAVSLSDVLIFSVNI